MRRRPDAEVMLMKHLLGNVRFTQQRGLVMVIALLSIILLAALVFYIYNVGQHVERRVEVQNAADAAAIGASTQVARAFNTVAANNVATTRMIAMINILDSLPMAVDFSVRDAGEGTLDDVEALSQSVDWQLDRGVSDVWAQRLLERMTDGSDGSLPDIDSEIQELDTFFQGNPDFIPNMTHYDPPQGDHGSIWQAMYAMDMLSQMTIASLPTLPQQVAVEAGEEVLNTRRVSVGQSFLLPFRVQVPIERGVFDDFERPVKRGLLPGDDNSGRIVADSVSEGLGQVDDPVIRRGPYDAVYGWRRYDDYRHSGGRIPGPAMAPIASSPSSTADPTDYWVYGPQQWMQYRLPNWWHRGRSYDRLTYWLDRLSDIKLRYLFENAAPISVVDPEWEIDIEADNERSDDDNEFAVFPIADETMLDENGDEVEIKETAFVVMEMKSTTSDNPGHASMQGETWQYIQRTSYNLPFVLWASGWRDPRDGPPIGMNSSRNNAQQTGYRKIDNYIWRQSGTYEVTSDPELGLPLVAETVTDPDTGEEYQQYRIYTIYWERDFMLVGANIGPDVEVPNPYEGFDRDASDAPAPYDLIHDEMDFDDETNRSRYLEFLGVARRVNTPGFWPSRFGSGPYDNMVGLAQTHVFNNHSRDLWTQMWHAQLRPIDAYDHWVSLMENDIDAADTVDGLDPSEIPELSAYLRNLEPLSEVMLTH